MKIACKFLIPALLILSTLCFENPALADWTYTVKRGDTLFSVAKRVGIPVNSLKQRNGIWSGSLRIGQRIIIPTTTTRTAARPVSGNIDLLSRLVHAEAGAEPYLGKVAVCAVILNRVQNPRFPKTVTGVIYQPHAFESVSNGTIYRPYTTESRKAAQAALSGWDPSGGALYFFNPAKTNNPWIWARRIINRIGKHVFAI